MADIPWLIKFLRTVKALEAQPCVELREERLIVTPLPLGVRFWIDIWAGLGASLVSQA